MSLTNALLKDTPALCTIEPEFIPFHNPVKDTPEAFAKGIEVKIP